MSTTSAPSATSVTADQGGEAQDAGTPGRSSSRRLQRSTRLTVATGLVALSALLVVGAVPTGSWLLVSAAAVASVVLGLAASRITYAELRESRREHQRDRAEQAQAYRRLAEARAEEHAARVATLNEQIAEREKALEELGTELGGAQKNVAEGVRALGVEKRRYEELQRLQRRTEVGRDEAENRAAEAIVSLAELEGEVETLRAELQQVTAAWHRAEAASRRHA
ncbi:hypothetical protein [Nocardioides bruguierae]|uniref:hypothetical protein n=1 Tax=Nocardioides bruguierae TaxID=2945102 RepID=UPI0020206287|nr:hypothetical protein [Nocardioides bruguierae]MCL8026181.1 hypothetical protein [Nocardioides bruguierae]